MLALPDQEPARATPAAAEAEDTQRGADALSAPRARELNPYWRDGGDGLPPTRTDRDAAVPAWRARMLASADHDALARARTPPVAEAGAGPVAAAGADADADRQAHMMRAMRDQLRTPAAPHMAMGSATASQSAASAKPACSPAAAPQPVPASAVPPVPQAVAESQLNQLAARLVRAEMMGNMELVERLRAELETARAAAVPARDGVQTVRIDCTVDHLGRMRPLPVDRDAGADDGDAVRKRIRPSSSTISAEGVRTRHYDDDDQYTLQDLVRQERLGDADAAALYDRAQARAVLLAGKGGGAQLADEYTLDDAFEGQSKRIVRLVGP